ncbi:MAG: alpha/beta fold hydrolase [Prochlorococcaceae cyanobacterium]
MAEPGMAAADGPAVPPEWKSMMLPVQAGRCRLWAGNHCPATASDSLPLLVCHGGPGVPSDYLFPLSGQLQRPVIFFDQLGCGRSERPSPDVEEYSIVASVQDLVEVAEALVAKALIPMRQGRPAYHLYGQSFGGILAFEALSSDAGLPIPRSLTLSNVPSSVPLLLEEVAALLANLDGDAARFDAAHVCRRTPRPAELLAAYAPGHPGSHWRGVDVIEDWCAPEQSLSSLTLPVLLLAGEHDCVWSSFPGRRITPYWRCPRFMGSALSVSCGSTRNRRSRWDR